MDKKKGSFTGSLGFILAAAGSAVGVGNIWRFPYLAAKDGGGLFILIYLVLVLTFGFTLLTTDIAIGRKTRKNALQAFGSISPKWGFLGKLTFLVPALIMTYYSVIGGWITKYLFDYVVTDGVEAAGDGYFVGFITSETLPIVFMLIFLLVTIWIVYRGVEKGIEQFSKFVMPGLLLLIIGIAIFSLTLKHTDATGVTRTGIDGLMVYLRPDFEGLTLSKFLNILLDAMSQLFFSLSVSMGIMITYGSYVKKETHLEKSITQIEIFDTGVALIAGMMIIPAVFVFFGMEGMGYAGRKKVCMGVGIFAVVTAVIICLGYNVLYFEAPLPNGSTGQLLDIADYISNSFLMPLISFLTCIFIGWVVKPGWIEGEMLENGAAFHKKRMYEIMVRYVAPLMMGILFLQSTGIFGFLGWE